MGARTGAVSGAGARGQGKIQSPIFDMWDLKCFETLKWKCLINTWLLESEPEIKMERH